MRQKKKWIILFFTTVFLLLITLILKHHQVENTITNEDIAYIKKFLPTEKITSAVRPINYEEEIQFIIKVQSSVLGIAPDNIGIPYNQKREPKNLYLAKSGLCYDRSRVIEKILRFSGFRTRHISIYSEEQTGSAFKSLVTPSVSSHAITEVLTLKGWLVVDSNSPWISLDKDKDPISIGQLQGDVGNASITFSKPFPSKIYEKSFTYVYGLYSRHGRFYAPYNYIPDINYQEFIQNFL